MGLAVRGFYVGEAPEEQWGEHKAQSNSGLKNSLTLVDGHKSLCPIGWLPRSARTGCLRDLCTNLHGSTVVLRLEGK